eukprot:CAMPEP_0115302336 /NCGR_PEP_ID=MMETSP0270-20121206/70330_1 /TAXON_ID=71861 /ORGANISM="Scrippsiella trochoidea, Strain CCMP3099" /LENGTH=129 /DNA_ID=CAMNT_0002720259 /DNA_START=100 /DNA_END=489 /DNA_ORIENTATION=+
MGDYGATSTSQESSESLSELILKKLVMLEQQHVRQHAPGPVVVPQECCTTCSQAHWQLPQKVTCPKSCTASCFAAKNSELSPPLPDGPCPRNGAAPAPAPNATAVQTVAAASSNAVMATIRQVNRACTP